MPVPGVVQYLLTQANREREDAQANFQSVLRMLVARQTATRGRAEDRRRWDAQFGLQQERLGLAREAGARATEERGEASAINRARLQYLLSRGRAEAGPGEQGPDESKRALDTAKGLVGFEQEDYEAFDKLFPGVLGRLGYKPTTKSILKPRGVEGVDYSVWPRKTPSKPRGVEGVDYSVWPRKTPSKPTIGVPRDVPKKKPKKSKPMTLDDIMDSLTGKKKPLTLRIGEKLPGFAKNLLGIGPPGAPARLPAKKQKGDDAELKRLRRAKALKDRMLKTKDPNEKARLLRQIQELIR